MKKLLFLALPLFVTACDPDPFPLHLAQYDVLWRDRDNTGTRTPNDDLEFRIDVETTDPDFDDQVIREWEFTYFVNGQYGGVLQGDHGLRSNHIGMNGVVRLGNLDYPGSGSLQPGDVVEFRFWCIDNCGTEVDRSYEIELE